MTWKQWLQRAALVAAGCAGLAMASPGLHSAPKSDDHRAQFAALERKLETVLTHQTTILQRLDTVLEELRIIKVRASN